MTQYIDKAVIVMVIEKLIAKYKEISVGVDKKGNDWVDSVSMLNAKIDTLQSLLSIIPSLEVKEIDLENYVHGTVDYPIIGSDFPNIYPNYKELKNYCDKNRITDNDKVKLIIVKEDMP